MRSVCAGREGWGRGKACQPEKHRPEKQQPSASPKAVSCIGRGDPAGSALTLPLLWASGLRGLSPLLPEGGNPCAGRSWDSLGSSLGFCSTASYLRDVCSVCAPKCPWRKSRRQELGTACSFQICSHCSSSDRCRALGWVWWWHTDPVHAVGPPSACPLAQIWCDSDLHKDGRVGERAGGQWKGTKGQCSPAAQGRTELQGVPTARAHPRGALSLRMSSHSTAAPAAEPGSACPVLLWG